LNGEYIINSVPTCTGSLGEKGKENEPEVNSPFIVRDLPLPGSWAWLCLHKVSREGGTKVIILLDRSDGQSEVETDQLKGNGAFYTLSCFFRNK